MTGPRVFISYSHDSDAHREAVLQLAQQLRSWGVDVRLDRFVTVPEDGWSRWMIAQVDEADFVLLVCTAIYRRRFEGRETAGTGRGVTLEGLLSIQHIHDANTRNTKFIPVTFTGNDDDVSPVLRSYQRYTLPGQLEALYRHLTGQPEIVAVPLGARKIFPSHGAAAPITVSAAPARQALPQVQVRSEGGGDARIEPAELLHRLLLSLFTSADEFRQWVSLGPGGGELAPALPGGEASTSAVLFGGLELLRKRGHLDAEFFARLTAHVPRRNDDIARVAALWGAPPRALQAQPTSFARLDPFPGAQSDDVPPDQVYVELDVVGERHGDVLHLRFHFHNDAALVDTREVPGLAALVQRVRERGPVLTGPAAQTLGQAMAASLFGRPGEVAYHKLFRRLFREPAGARTCAARRPVRCRLHFADCELRALPWSLLAEDGHWLADAGWRVELAAVAVDRNHARILLQAPCPTLLIVPDVSRTATFDPAQHRDDLAALLVDLWRKTVDEHLLGQYVLRASTWPNVQELARRADLVYVCARASDHSGRWTLKLDGPRTGSQDVRFDELLRAVQHSAKVVYLNVAAPRIGALASALPDLAGPPCVIAPWTADFGPDAEAAGRQWLRAVLGEGHDPASALHVVTREQATARAGTMQAITRHRGWTTVPAPAERYTGRARLHVDRRNQRLRFWDLLQSLARHDTRRVEAVVAYGEVAHGIEALPDLLEQHVCDTCDREVKASVDVVRDSHLLPHPRHDLETSLHDAVCSALHIPLGGTIGGALTRRFATIDTDRGTRKIWWLDWGVVDVEEPLKPAELLAWLRYHTRTLASQCPKDLRIVATLCVAASAAGCKKLAEFLEHKIPDEVARTATASVTALPELHLIHRSDLVDYLELHSSCPARQIGAVADALIHATGGSFEAIVARIEAVERREQTWDHLAGSTPPATPKPADDEDFR